MLFNRHFADTEAGADLFAVSLHCIVYGSVRLRQLAELVKRFEAEAVEAVQMTLAEFGRYIEQDTAKWARVIREAGITPQ